LKDISISNAGFLSASISDHVKRTIPRSESCTIYLQGLSELIAENISLSGPFTLTVPHGKRAILSQTPSGELKVTMQDCSSPTWEYQWDWDGTKAPELFFKKLE
jgi:hypothetical protein